MTDASLHALQSLLDQRAIEDLVIRYCRAADRRDWAAMATLYHDDAEDDHGSLFRGSARDYLAWLPGMAAKMLATWHQISNHHIVVRGTVAEVCLGDAAFAEQGTVLVRIKPDAAA